MCTPLNGTSDKPFTFVELQKAKDVLDACDFISPSTKSCYSSRIAMWIHYSNMYCRSDDHVTERRLADYVEWMVSSGAAERIRQGVTHLQQVLRNQLQGVLCYWRIQNGGRSNISDPRLGPIFIEKWQQIAMRFPRPRQARRTEPIYGTQKGPGASPNEDIKQHAPGPATHVNQLGGAPYNNQGNRMRTPHMLPRDHTGHPAGPPPSIAPNSGPMPRHAPTAPGAPSTGYAQGMPPTRQQFPPGPAGDARMYENKPYQRPNYYPNRDARYPRDMRPIPPYGNQQRMPPAQAQPDQTLLPRPPVPRLGQTPSTNTSGFTSGPSYPSAMNAPLPTAPSTKNDSYLRTAANDKCDEQINISGSAQPPCSPGSWQGNYSDAPLAPAARRHLTEDTRSLSAVPGQASPPLEVMATSAPSSPGPVSKIAVETEQTVEGVVPEALPHWDSGMANGGKDAPEGHLLNVNEEIALNIQHLDSGTVLRTQARAHHALGMATWMSVSTRNALTLADLSIGDLLVSESDVPVQEESKADGASKQELHEEQPPKVLTIAMRPESEEPATFVEDKTAVLRHTNPLLCSWSALAMLLFTRWHISNETAPDFGTTEWQSQRLFQENTDKPESEESDSIAKHLASAMSKISNDKIDGAQTMSECGFFYADTFGLVKPTFAGIKGLATVDAIDATVLQPSVLTALVRANAGYNADVSVSTEQPKRVDVKPPQSLLKEVFPWLKTALIDAFRQNKNNEDVHAARRILQVLRELRVVLLQDVAFMMEVPSLAERVKDSPLFNHAIFKSAAFLAFREDMSKAAADSEAKHIDSLCVEALRWTGERKQSQPEGDSNRMNPTAPRRLALGTVAEQPAPVADALQNGHMRQHEPANSIPAVASREQTSEGTESETSPKRPRHVYDAIASSSAGRIFGDVPASTLPADSSVEAAMGASGESAPSEMAKIMEKMRSENEDLKAQLRRLEWVLSQHKTEVRSWMSKIEKGMHTVSVGVKRPLTPPPASELVPQRYPDTAAPGYAETDISAKAQRMLSSAQPSPALPQRVAYDGQYRVPPTPKGDGNRQIGLPSEARGGVAPFERQIRPQPVRSSQAVAMHSANQDAMADYRSAEYSKPEYRPAEYRPADRIDSPRTQRYIPRATPQMKYAASRYPPPYGGAPSSQQQQQQNGFNFNERPVYGNPYNGV
ncbi:hypothetical protein H4R24_003725 [Coemansia sp. RSA 988]|nr:hypothetical protein H4R24_003725 [Coemansia sp. RSA 988]